ncbi:MAG: PKD domain-containing protein [Bacteroidetes bacterium]|nr:PKD domain-containing protein [Bacteroidota bacterium]
MTYVWTPSTGLLSTTGNPVMANPSTSITYTVVGTDANGCSNTATVEVEVQPFNTVTFDPVAPQACVGTCDTITIHGAATYEWSPSTDMTALNDSVWKVCPAVTTTYTITATDAYGCSGTTTVLVNVYNAPSITATANPGLICPTASTTLTASGGSTYEWQPDYNLSSSTGTVITGSPTTTTIYTVTGTDINGCSGSAQATVIVHPIPAIYFVPSNPSFCAGGTTMITVVGGVSYSWSPSTGLSSTNSSVVWATPPATTTYTVTGNNANGCPFTETVTVNVFLVPIADAGADAGVFCNGPPVTIGTPTVSGYTYSWNPAIGLSDPNIAQPLANPGMSLIYTLTVSSGNGCSATDDLVFTVTNTPMADAGPPVSLDCGATVGEQIGTPGVLGLDYQWSPSGYLSNPNVAQPIATPQVTTNYTVTVINADGCSATDAVTVTVTPVTLANAGPNDTIECGDTVPVIIGTPAVAGMVYSWSPATGLSNPSIAQPSALPSGTTNYTLTVSDTVNGCISTDVVLVKVNNTPYVEAGPNKTLACNDPVGVQIGTAAIFGYSYSWSPSPSNPNIAQPIANPLITTTYTLIVTNPDGCTASDAVVVTLLTSAVVNPGPNKTIDCNGGGVQIGTPAVSGMTYSWAPGGSLFDPNAAQTLATPTTSTTYTLVVTSPDGCSASGSMVVTVLTDALANAGPDMTIDCGGTGVMIGTPAVSGNTYSWSPTTGIVGNPNIAQPTANPGITTVYTLTVMSADTCYATDDVQVYVNTLANVPPMTNQTTDCNGTGVVIGTPPISGMTYSWSPSSGLNFSNISQPTATPTTTTIYTLTVLSPDGCSAFGTVTVTVLSTPVANAGQNKTIVCNGGGVTIGTPAISGNTYSWTPALGLSNPNVAQPFANPTVTTDFIVTVQNANGCTQKDTMTLTVQTLAVAEAGVNKTINCGGPGVVIGTDSLSGMSYQWAPSTGLSNPNTAKPVASPLATTIYSLTVTSPDGCQATDIVTVFVNNPSPANAGIDKTVDCAGIPVVLGSDSVAGLIYSWTPTAGLNSANAAKPSSMPTASTIYTLTVTTLTGCFSTDDVIVTVNTTAVAAAGPDKTINCGGGGVIIGTPSQPDMTYQWSPASGLSPTTIAQPTANPAITTVYTLTVISTDGCQATDEVTITVQTSAVPPVLQNKTIACGSTGVVIGSPAQPGMIYSWVPTDLSLNNPNIAQPIASPTTSTTYTLTVTSTDGCAVSGTCSVTVLTDAVANAGPDMTIDCGSTGVSIGTPSQPDMIYSWSPGGTSLSNPNIAQPIANPDVTTIFTLTVTSTDGCSKTDAVTVTVNSDAVLPILPNKTIPCGSVGVTIGPHSVPGMTYSWVPNDLSLSNPNIAQPIASPHTTTIYTLTVESPEGCEATGTVTVFVLTTADAKAGPNQTIGCNGTGVTIGTPTEPGMTYSWTPALGLSNPNIAQPVANPLASTDFILTVTSPDGCFDRDTVTVTVNSLAHSDPGPNRTIACNGAPVSIGTAAIPGNSYSWTPSAGLSPNPNIAQPSACPTTTTVYTLTVVSPDGCLDVDEVTVTVLTTASANAGPDQTRDCNGTPVTIGTPGDIANTYQWSPDFYLDDFTSAQSVATPTTTTSYTLTVTSPDGCAATDAVTITVLTSVPGSGWGGPNKTINCGDFGIQIGSADNPSLTYSWSPCYFLNQCDVSQPVATPPMTTIYTLTVSNSDGCSVTDDIKVTVLSEAYADAGPNKTINCLDTGVMIGTPEVLGNIYNWDGTGLLNPNIAQPIAQPGITTDFIVTVLSPDGCQDKDTVTVFVMTSAVANAGPDKLIICGAAGVQIGTDTISGMIYSWSPTAGLNNPTFAEPTANPGISTIYTLTVESPDGCSASDFVSVTVQTSAIVSPGPNKTIGCNDPGVQIGTADVVGMTYSWAPALGLNNPNIAQPVANPTATTVYTLTVASPDGCSASGTVTVFVLTSAFADAGPNKTIDCGDPGVLIGTIIAGMDFEWTPPDWLDDPNTALPFASPLATTTYTVTTTSIDGCHATDEVTVTVNGTPPVNAGPDKAIECGMTTSVTIGTPGDTSLYYYSWSPDDFLAEPTSPQTISIPLSSITYTLTVMSKSGNCISTDEVVITIINPVDANAGSDKSIDCDGFGISIGTPGLPSLNYEWTPAAGLSVSTIAQPVANPNFDTEYILTVTDPVTGCYDVDTMVVTVLNQPPVNAGPNRSVSCGAVIGATIGTTGSPAYTYQWSPPDGLSNTTVDRPLALPDATTTYTLVVTDPVSGCQNSDEMVVTVIGAPIIPPIADKTISCTDLDSVLIGTSSNPGFTYNWSPATGLGSPTSASTYAWPVVTTVYTLTMTDIFSGCWAQKSVTVYVMGTPVIDAGNDTTLCSGNPVSLSVEGTGLVSPIGYEWSTNEFTQTIVVTPTAQTTYSVTVTNGNGCVATDQVTIFAKPSPVVNFGADVVAPPGPVTLNPTVSGGTPPYSYLWNTGSTSPPPALIIGMFDSTIVLTVIDDLGCVGTDTVLIDIVPVPVAEAGNDTMICLGTNATLTGEVFSGTPPFSYLWSTNEGTQCITVSPVVTTHYFFSVTDHYNILAVDSVTVTVAPVPTVNLPPDTTACYSDPIVLSVGVADHYLWSTSDTTQSITLYPTDTIVIGVWVYNSYGCSASDQIIINIRPYSVPDISPSGKTVFCDGEPVDVTLTAESGFSDYTWSDNTNAQSLHVTVAGGYYVVATDVNGCNIHSDTIMIIGQPPFSPHVISMSGSSYLCEDESVFLTVDSTFFAHYWNTGSTTPLILANEEGEYYVTVWDNNGCAGFSDTLFLMVVEGPLAYFGYQMGDSMLYNFFDQSLYSDSVHWSFGDGEQSTELEPQHQYSDTGYYNVTIVVTNNCGTDSITQVVHVVDNTGIGEFAEVKRFILYPNPARQKVYLEYALSTEAEATVYLENLFGSRIISRTIKGNGGRIELDVSTLPAGPYIVILRTDSDLLIRKLIVY